MTEEYLGENVKDIIEALWMFSDSEVPSAIKKKILKLSKDIEKNILGENRFDVILAFLNVLEKIYQGILNSEETEKEAKEKILFLSGFVKVHTDSIQDLCSMSDEELAQKVAESKDFVQKFKVSKKEPTYIK